MSFGFAIGDFIAVGQLAWVSLSHSTGHEALTYHQ